MTIRVSQTTVSDNEPATIQQAIDDVTNKVNKALAVLQDNIGSKEDRVIPDGS